MNDNRKQADPVEERKREGKLFHVVGQDSAADLDDGKLVGGGKDAEVALDLRFGRDRVEQPNDGFLTAATDFKTFMLMSAQS